MATINKIDLNGDTYDIESSALVTTQPTTPSEGATYYDTVNDEVKVYDGSNWNSVGGGGSVAFATSSTAGNVAEKVVSVPSITTLNVGQILCIQPTASATVANLTIKLNNFTAYPIRYNNGAITTTTDDLVWNQNFVSQFVFDGTYRQFVSHGYDNNTSYTQNILFDRGGFVSGSGTYAISRYIICLQKPDMTWEKITNTEEDYSVANDKTVNTHGFLLNGEMLYYSNTTVLANGAVSAANTMYRQNAGFDMRYSMNTTGTGYTAGDYIYLVGTIGADGLYYLDATQWWTNTLPSTNDGKVYVKVGKYVSGVTITLEIDHPAYYHDGTRIREYKGVNEPKVSSTAPSSPTEGMIWYDTTNDVLKVYDGTNWVEVGKEYNAGEGIGIGTAHSDMQGPAPSGYHVPLTTEWQGLKTIMDGLSLTTGDGWKINLHMPFAGFRFYNNASLASQGSYGFYWSSSHHSASSYDALFLNLNSSIVSANNYSKRANCYSVRCFKDSYVTPDSTWTVVQGTLGSAGIFWNQSQGLISITDGTTGYTIMDKNLGATTVYNDGDTLTQANMGYMYQRGNNYGFPSTGTISNTSTTQVDASTYGPGNYYNSSTFITGSNDWSSVQNDNLWGGVSKGIWISNEGNAIINTGVLSVNGQTGNVTVNSGIPNDTTGTTSAISGEWVGTQAEFDALSSYGNKIYNIIE